MSGHGVAIYGDYGVTCSCTALLRWPLGWSRTEKAAQNLVKEHCAPSPAADHLRAILDGSFMSDESRQEANAALRTLLEGGLDVAWAETEAALPADWELEISGPHENDKYTATASYRYSLRHYRENVGRARFAPFEMEHADIPAAALRALAARLSEPKP